MKKYISTLVVLLTSFILLGSVVGIGIFIYRDSIDEKLFKIIAVLYVTCVAVAMASVISLIFLKPFKLKLVKN